MSVAKDGGALGGYTEADAVIHAETISTAMRRALEGAKDEPIRPYWFPNYIVRGQIVLKRTVTALERRGLLRVIADRAFITENGLKVLAVLAEREKGREG